MNAPTEYVGPFLAPTFDPVTDSDVVAWRHISEPDPDAPGRWRPRGFVVIRTNSVQEWELDGTIMRDSMLFAPTFGQVEA